MTEKFASYMTKAVPRYTSYPTAPHFTEQVGSIEYEKWLSELNPSDPISLYLHVPYCRQVCWYCGCNMKLASKDAPILNYATVLAREVELLADRLPMRMKCSHLHWGGGTPTALSPDALAMVMETVFSNFVLTDDAEIAIESDPRTLSADMIKEIGKLGFTRASFGVQEFDLKVQKAINRIQPPEMVRSAVDGLRDAGVTGINFDLIYGLPHQTVETLLSTIDLCSEMRPDRIALFGYAHVPWMAKKQRMIDDAALPGANERMAQARSASDAIIESGYVPIGLDHFALPDDPLARAANEGTLRRNFQGYTTDFAKALLGVGSTSIGKTPGGYAQNIAETGAWERAVRSGELPVKKGIALSLDDKLRAAAIEGIMCHGKVDLELLTEQFGVSIDWHKDIEPDLKLLERDGLIRWNNSEISVCPEALSLVRVITAVFDAYLQNSTTKHSIAV